MNIFIDDSSGIPTDPNFASVVLLLHFDGTNGSSTLTDSSSYNRTATRNGNAQITTTGPLFGTGAGLFDGTGDNWTFPSSTDFDLTSGLDYTIEGRAYADVNNELNFLCANRSDSGGDQGWIFYVSATGKLTFTVVAPAGGGGSQSVVGATTITTGTWFSWAMTKASGSTRLFLNGTVDGTGSIQHQAAASNGLLRIGSSSGEDGTRDWKGKLDEVRFTRSVARYTANYTPSASAFPDA